MMRSAGALKERPEIQEYAALATENGLPGEVLSMIDEVRAQGSIPANDARFNEIYATQKARTAGDKAALDADAAKGAALPTARRARGTADALMGYGDYAKAAALYQVALDKGDPEADLVRLRLGVAQHRAGNHDAAKATLATVGGTRKRLATLWTTHIKQKQAPAAPAAPAPTTGR
ncbi:MAG: tetratricopeptide repeat protein [Sphingopyxis sp.]|nr:tetratricopeptide repeat protein [Sphingopyxis sp.]